jgi:predicted anti-sigma-YlaC factor YlaD
MLSCADFLAEFGDYLDNSADPDIRARLEAHLHDCKTCRVIVDSTRKTIKIVTDSDSFAVPAENVDPIVKDVVSPIRAKKP